MFVIRQLQVIGRTVATLLPMNNGSGQAAAGELVSVVEYKDFAECSVTNMHS